MQANQSNMFEQFTPNGKKKSCEIYFVDFFFSFELFFCSTLLFWMWAFLLLLPVKRPLIVVTKTSWSYSHSNQIISFPRAKFINCSAFYEAFIFETGIRIHAQFHSCQKSSFAGCITSPAATQLIEKCFVAWRILMHSYQCTDITRTLALVIVLCTCFVSSVWVYVCVFLHLGSWIIWKKQPVMCFFLLHLTLVLTYLFLTSYCSSGDSKTSGLCLCLCLWVRTKKTNQGRQ